ncbi:TetR/AcrR family transcriptional regulator [Streptomyces sp. NBC_01808]|uniref:TetR/AcrR family transcriptional regulator n=1 Tax=Streptomyces sp. NBC_01808 TaxID=2975947 RepID=UPI002DD7A3C9|nr:TetR/AcrR family transcriptional regulator [Streptomyces sp. NBC_01808]WSA39820.1 TetR/AcrR family transcriptional regulator [Streptomyces sp. NBC_01808]
MSAEERRESVIRAAITEFGRGGYHGTSTESIAKRVGVSQPYLFRLFPNKRAIFLAASLRCIEETAAVLRAASEKAPAGREEKAMGAAYQRLIEDRDLLMMQMQMHVAVASAESSGDHEFGEPIRAAWSEQLYDLTLLTFGGDAETAARFLAYGMLINTLVALGYAPRERVWDGFWPETLPNT